MSTHKNPFVVTISALVCLVVLAFSARGALAEQSALTFFGWSDQHVQTDGNGDHLVPAIDAMNGLPGRAFPENIGGVVAEPEFVFGLGDITEWPTHAAKDAYNRLITGRLRFPSYDVAGNHDSGGLSPSRTVHDWLIRRHGSLSYTFDKGGVHFVALFSEYDENLNRPAQPITKEALEQLRNDLAKVPNGEPVVVATHLCFESITNKDELVDAFGDTNVILVLGGHYHKATVNRYRGFNFVQLPSPAPESPDELTVVRITSDRLVAIPFDYANDRWVSDQGRILDTEIKGPSGVVVAELLHKPEDVKTLEIGESAPDFSLPGVDGRICSLRDFSEAKILAVIFTCNHCPTAQAYEDRIKRLVSEYGGKGVAVVGISPNDPKAVRLDELGYTDLSDSLEEMKIRAKDKDYNFPYLYDGDSQAVSRAYGPATTPHVFLFDEDRKLRFVGRIDDNERIGKATVHDTRNAIEALLEGKSVAVEKTKTFGCSIKWSYKRGSVKEGFDRWAKEKVELKMIDAEGVKALLKNDSGKLRLVNFWSTRGGACVTELVDINRMYRRRDFELITISLDTPAAKEKALSFLKQEQASCTNYQFDSDDPQRLIDVVERGFTGDLPYTLLIAPRGRVVSSYAGSIRPLQVKKDIVGFLGRYYK